MWKAVLFTNCKQHWKTTAPPAWVVRHLSIKISLRPTESNYLWPHQSPSTPKILLPPDRSLKLWRPSSISGVVTTTSTNHLMAAPPYSPSQQWKPSSMAPCPLPSSECGKSSPEDGSWRSLGKGSRPKNPNTLSLNVLVPVGISSSFHSSVQGTLLQDIAEKFDQGVLVPGALMDTPLLEDGVSFLTNHD